MTQQNRKKLDVTSLIIVLTMILVVLKAFGLISISWVWVLSPLWGWAALLAVITLGIVALTFLAVAVKKWALKKSMKP